ncbi:hypothetical protein NKH73_15375 [Mesorhizobium sp. M0938]|uniref:hypothetical protein n=1 Tax=unclassified Mesorhizobium TaxID=325217 RepID=UPI00333564BB
MGVKIEEKQNFRVRFLHKASHNYLVLPIYLPIHQRRLAACHPLKKLGLLLFGWANFAAQIAAPRRPFRSRPLERKDCGPSAFGRWRRKAALSRTSLKNGLFTMQRVPRGAKPQEKSINSLIKPDLRSS